MLTVSMDSLSSFVYHVRNVQAKMWSQLNEPKLLNCYEKYIDHLRADIQKSLKEGTTSFIIVIGGRGTEKKSIVDFVLNDSKTEVPPEIFIIRTDCSHIEGIVDILQSWCSQLGISIKNERTTELLMNDIIVHLKQARIKLVPVIFILNNFHELLKSEKMRFLYELLNFIHDKNLFFLLICISHRTDIYRLIDKRILSRLNPHCINIYSPSTYDICIELSRRLCIYEINDITNPYNNNIHNNKNIDIKLDSDSNWNEFILLLNKKIIKLFGDPSLNEIKFEYNDYNSNYNNKREFSKLGEETNISSFLCYNFIQNLLDDGWELSDLLHGMESFVLELEKNVTTLLKKELTNKNACISYEAIVNKLFSIGSLQTCIVGQGIPSFYNLINNLTLNQSIILATTVRMLSNHTIDQIDNTYQDKSVYSLVRKSVCISDIIIESRKMFETCRREALNDDEILRCIRSIAQLSLLKCLHTNGVFLSHHSDITLSTRVILGVSTSKISMAYTKKHPTGNNFIVRIPDKLREAILRPSIPLDSNTNFQLL